MIEKTKSVLLAALVFSSLLQSYLLAYSTPKFDSANQTEYVETEPMGSQEELENLIFPEQIILHFGDGKHTVLPPDMTFYNSIFQVLRHRTFDGLRPANEWNLKWDEYRSSHQGVEIRFAEGIPLNVLQRMMQVKSDDLYNNTVETINRMWIVTKKNQEDISTYFFSDATGNIYEATKVDLIVKDVERFVGFGKYLTTYHTIDGTYYLPDQPLSIVKYRIPFSEFTPQQLQKSLFVDPGITRNLRERDGTEIYTDGKRGLQVKKDQHWMIYTDPVAPVDSENDVKENLLSAVQFINQHGGWNGKYVVSEISDDLSKEGQSIVFRQYLNSYPVIPAENANYGNIKVEVRKGVVSTYERSLIKLGERKVQQGLRRLVAGEELDQLIKRYPQSFAIHTVFPAYHPYISNGYIDLVPEWAVQLKDGTIDFLN